MKTAIFTVVYPGVENYLPNLFESLDQQTDQNFTVYIINDGLTKLNDMLEGITFDCLVMEAQGKPVVLRKKGLKWMQKECVDQIIFVDADDYMANDRVAIVNEYLKGNSIVVNELMLFGDQYINARPMLSSIYSDDEKITLEHLLNGNCMGLTNTAMRSSAITRKLEEISDDMVAFDWAFFSLCLLDGASAVFTDKTQTFYRQHGRNVAVVQDMTEEQVMRAVNIKKDYYDLMAKWAKDYQKNYFNFSALLKRLSNEQSFRVDYIKAVRKISYPLWWEMIRLPEEFNL